MKVLDLRCAQGHAFEGWFASEDDFGRQMQGSLVECPLCGDHTIVRLPSAPRLNISGARAPEAVPAAPPAGPATPAGATTQPVTTMDQAGAAGLQALWVQAVREVIKNTEDVGARFPEEARRIHYGETEARGIRGRATQQQRDELSEEGIDVMPLVIPDALKGPTH